VNGVASEIAGGIVDTITGGRPSNNPPRYPYPQNNGPYYPQNNGPYYPQNNGPYYPQNNGPYYPQSNNGPYYPQSNNGPYYPQNNGYGWGRNTADAKVNVAQETVSEEKDITVHKVETEAPKAKE
jgi:hypothetical protein